LISKNIINIILSNISDNRSSSKSHEESTIDLAQSLIECEKITQLVLENRLNEALQKTKEQFVLILHLHLSKFIHFLQ